MNHFTYHIKNTVNGKVYYGKTCDPSGRWKDHVYNAKHGCRFPIHCAMRKYGVEAFEFKLLKEYSTNEQSSLDERLLIYITDPKHSYNVADGGDGGHTMSRQQLDQQYAIRSSDRGLFLQLFNEGLTTKSIAQRLGVSASAVRSCAKRLGVSFAVRRSTKKSLKTTVVTTKRSRGCFKRVLSEQHRAMRSALLTSINVARGVSNEVKQQIVNMYFGPDHLSAIEVARTLGVGHGSVHNTVSHAYAAMNVDERLAMKKQRASIVRKGDRNSNSRAKRKLLSGDDS